MKEKNIREMARRMNLVSIDDMCRYSIPQLVVMIANKMNELMDEAGQFESDVQEILKTQNEKIQYLLDEGLLLEVENVFNGWFKDGTFDTLINQSALKKVNERIDETNSQLSEKASTIDNLQGQINNLVIAGTGDSNPEVVQARGKFNVLNDRLNKNDVALSAVSVEVWETQTVSKNTGYVKTDGSTTNSNYHTSLPVSQGEEYWVKTVSGWDLKPYVLLNDNSAVVGYYSVVENSQVYHGYENNTLKIKIPTGATRLVVNSFDNNYLEVKKYLYNKVNSKNIKELPEQVVTINALDGYISNLFSENYKLQTLSSSNGFMEITGKLNTTTAGHSVISVSKGDRFKITTNYGYNMAPYVLVTEGGVVIDYLKSDSPNTITTKSFPYETPSDGLLYINTYNPLITSLEKFEGYKIKDSDSNPLTGKKVLFFGDSITESQGSWASSTTIISKNNMTGSNFGVGGSKYTVTSTADNSNCIYNRVKSLYNANTDADFIILSGLVNDALQGMPLGSMLSKSNFTSDCDTSTVYGAFEMTIRYVLENWKGKKVGFIITPNIPSSSTLNNYFDVARNVCKKYSVPYLDLYYDSGLCVGIPTIKTTYYKGDDIHPNVLGYEKYINDKVETFMRSL